MNRNIKKIISIILATSCIYLSSCSFNNSDTPKENLVTVDIECDNHVRTDSINPQTTIKGNDFNFHLIFDEGFTFLNSSEGNYDENANILTIDSLRGSRTINVYSINTSGYTLKVENDDELGDVKLDPEKEFYLPGEEVSVSVIPKNKEFLCYTLNEPYRTELKTTSGIPVSWDIKSIFKVDSDLIIYTNYFNNDDKIIEYDLNGGITANGNNIIRTDSFLYTNDDYLFSNSINLSQYAFKEGYVLESLNTKVDGSGTRIGIGSRINNNLFTNGALTLYCMWAKETSSSLFSYQVIDGSNDIMITGSSLSSETLVIPSFIDNKKVVKIAANAFKDNSVIENIVLPDTIVEIEDDAFSNLSNVKELTLYSSIEKVSKQSFDLSSLKTIHLNKNTHSLNYNYEEDNISRYKEAILNLDNSKSNVIIVGHSTTRVNHNLMPLKQKWGDNYNFFIYGASAGIHGSILLSSLLDIVRENDYLIIPIWPLINNSTRRNLAFLQYDFDRLADIDYQLIKDFIWQSFVDFRKTCTAEVGVSALLPEAVNYSRYDQFGMNLENNPTSDSNNKSPYDYTHYLDDYGGESFAWLDAVLDKYSIDKSHVLLTWNPYNENNINDLSLYSAFEGRIRTYFSDYSFFDSQLDNIYPGNYFNKNDFMHLSTAGTTQRVERWLNQLPF